ncbi:MAG: hypothetical protein K5678_02380 [Acetatifactor sp.]|nr:hypothetical protein [Acetatifactor sp.]
MDGCIGKHDDCCECVGSRLCWINQLHWLDENEVIRQFLYQYGLEEYETVTGALSLGYAEGGLPNRTPLPRKGNPINWE